MTTTDMVFCFENIERSLPEQTFASFTDFKSAHKSM